MEGIEVTTTKEESIIIFDEVSIIRQRVSNLFHEYNIHVYEASYDVEFYNLLYDNNLNINLIIMDIGYDVSKGFEILSKINEKRPEVPVFILTSNNKREIFVRGIAEGVADYILKPFENEYLLEKVLSVLTKKRKDTGLQIDSKSEIVFDIQSYLKTECKKATKGNYEITVIMCTLYIPDDELNTKLENRYPQVSDQFYKKYMNIIWDTDIFIRYGFRTFIGVFPYCGANNEDKIESKLKDSLEKVKKVYKELAPFQMKIATIIYPTEVEKPKELLITLGVRMQDEIDKKEKVITMDSSDNDKLPEAANA